MLRAKLGYRLDAWLEGVFLFFSKKGINPNILTFSGLALSMGASLALALGALKLGGILILSAGVFDVLDGVAARVYKRGTLFGTLLDSVTDRYSDLVVYVGLMIYYARQEVKADLVMAGIALIGCAVVPYVRARGENLVPECKVGLMERPERVILLSLGLLSGLLSPAVWLLAILCHITVLQRLYYVRKQLNTEREEPFGEEFPEAGSLEHRDIPEQRRR